MTAAVEAVLREIEKPIIRSRCDGLDHTQDCEIVNLMFDGYKCICGARERSAISKAPERESDHG